MSENRAIRRLAAILSADVKGYSQLMRNDEYATIEMIKICRGIIANLIQQYRGRVVDMPGDNILAEFGSVVDGVQAAVAIQKELKAKNRKLPNTRRMQFRIGINLGDIVAEDDRIYGDGVNVAARLEALADPGGICISRTAYDQIDDKLPLGYQYIGEKVVKSSKPIHAYRVIIDPEDIHYRIRRWTADRLGKERLFASGDADLIISEKKRLLTVLFCIVFGIFGAHRFYAGRVRSAKVMLCTLGGLGIWYIIDSVIVLFGEFTDNEGKKIKQWI